MSRSILLAITIVIIATVWMISGQFSGSEATSHAAVSEETDMPAEAGQVSAGQVKSSDTPHQPEDLIVTTEISIAQPFHSNLTLYGQTQAHRRVVLKSRTEGSIEEMPLTKGQFIEKDTLIAKLSADSRQQNLRKAQANAAHRQIEYKAAVKLSRSGYAAATKKASSQAALADAMASVSQAKLEIAYSQIKTPFNAILNQTYVEIGDFVQVGTEIAELLELNPILAAIDVTEQKVGSLEIGQMAEAHFINGETRQGVISYISRRASSDTRTFRVEVTLENPENKIPDQTSVEIRIPFNHQRAHFVSPSILTLNADGQIGVKFDQNGVAGFYPVDILQDTQQGMWVSGLPEELRLITNGQEFISVGTPINPQQTQTSLK